MKTVVEKDYNTESDIPMNDAKFTIGQKVTFGKDVVFEIHDVSWSVLSDSWLYTMIRLHDGTHWHGIFEADLLPL
jgi:hypothetical protein